MYTLSIKNFMLNNLILLENIGEMPLKSAF